MKFLYSAVIRSVGSNPILNDLVSCLLHQTIKPSEILIILPHDVCSWVTLQEDKIRFVHSERGMISQRMMGIRESTTAYILLLDDDILFTDNNAVENLFMEMINNSAVLALPYSPDAHPKSMLRLFNSFFGIALPTSKRHLGYTAGGGYYYPKKPTFSEGPYTVEGGRGCCIAANRDFLIKHDCLGDKDLEQVNYPLREDGAFILDIVRHGGKAILVDNIAYEHLGVARKLTPQRLFQNSEAMIYNNYVFWRKYFKNNYTKPTWPIICFSWHFVGLCIISFLIAVRHRSNQPIFGGLCGFSRIIKEKSSTRQKS